MGGGRCEPETDSMHAKARGTQKGTRFIDGFSRVDQRARKASKHKRKQTKSRHRHRASKSADPAPFCVLFQDRRPTFLLPVPPARSPASSLQRSKVRSELKGQRGPPRPSDRFGFSGKARGTAASQTTLATSLGSFRNGPTPKIKSHAESKAKDSK